MDVLILLGCRVIPKTFAFFCLLTTPGEKKKNIFQKIIGKNAKCFRGIAVALVRLRIQRRKLFKQCFQSFREASVTRTIIDKFDLKHFSLFFKCFRSKKINIALNSYFKNLFFFL